MRQNNSTNNKRHKNAESGNVFVFILLGVVLFAALSFSIARGFRSDTTSTMSARETELAATDILNYAQRVERAVNRIRRKGCSENDISFTGAPDHFNNAAAYNHTPQVDTKCRVFHPDGGSLSPTDSRNTNWHTSEPTAAPHTTFQFHGDMRVTDIGSNAVPKGADLLIWLPNINKDICLAINKQLGIPNPGGDAPRDTADNAFDGAGFTGTFGTALNQIDAPQLIGQPAGCFVSALNSQSEDRYFFYSVLLAR